MRDEYDFSNGRRGAIDPLPPGKTRITIRLDDEVIEWLRRSQRATPAQFEAKLREIYNRPAMRARFPDGF